MSRTATSDDAVELITLGCRLNASESDRMRALAREAGLSNAVIVNTCAVTNEAVRQSRQAIRKAARARPGARIIAAGCAVELDPATFADMPEVHRALGNALKLRRDSYGGGGPPAALPTPPARTRVPLEVQNGCDHRCTFCIIPFARGPSRSTPAGEAVAQARALIAAGAREIVLTGVDLTAWGADLPGRPGLGSLVRRLLKFAPELERLRLSSLDVIEIDDELVDLIATEPRLAPHLHLSLQHGHDLILKRMKRRHGAADAIALCRRLKAARPEIALGADLIAGFPTETEAHFEAMLDFVDACGLAYLHIFPFSPRDGAPAARMPQVDRAVVKARAARLREKAAQRLAQHLNGWTGRSAEALVEHEGFARLADFTGVSFAGAEPAGESVALRFMGHDGQNLIGAPA
ncbi:MAG: MiaB/RimO family radical SAM methylthiotransferase [Hyphomonadaceae bacterium]